VTRISDGSSKPRSAESPTFPVVVMLCRETRQLEMPVDRVQHTTQYMAPFESNIKGHRDNCRSTIDPWSGFFVSIGRRPVEAEIRCWLGASLLEEILVRVELTFHPVKVLIVYITSCRYVRTYVCGVVCGSIYRVCMYVCIEFVRGCPNNSCPATIRHENDNVALMFIVRRCCVSRCSC
jgi:hypothetical protein